MALGDGADVAGGTVSGSGGGKVGVVGTTATIADLTGSGSWRLEQGATLNVAGTTWTDNASVDMFWATLDVNGPVTVAGSGELVLGGPYGSLIHGAGLVNGASHTIRGFGEIRAPLTNSGTVRADVSTTDPYSGVRLVVNTNAKTNHGGDGGGRVRQPVPRDGSRPERQRPAAGGRRRQLRGPGQRRRGHRRHGERERRRQGRGCGEHGHDRRPHRQRFRGSSSRAPP